MNKPESEDKLFALFFHTIRDINEKLDRLYECIYGDGNPARGLTDRVSVIEAQNKHQIQLIKWIIRLVIFLIPLVGLKELPRLIELIGNIIK